MQTGGRPFPSSSRTSGTTVSDADDTELKEKLEAALGGRLGAIRRLSGGASRITSTFELELPSGEARTLVLQQIRGTALSRHPGVETEATLLRAARRAGVPVPEVVAAGAADRLGEGWLVVEHLDGETLPRRILRGDEYATARSMLVEQTAHALAAIHTIDAETVPALPRADPLRHPLEFLDALDETRPVLELGVRWLARNQPDRDESVVVHGDFRMGNFLVDETGLRGVLDWELAHRGNAAEDIGWLCARTWRFGGAGRVGGFGDLAEFLAVYRTAGGRAVKLEEVRWWEAYAAVKWAVICLLQAATHLSGSTRSVELAAIGRRACESEWDLLELLGVCEPPGTGQLEARSAGSVQQPPLFGTPSAAELLAAVQEYLESTVIASTEAAARFEARVARNVVAMVGRELELGQAAEAARAERLDTLGVADDKTLAAAIREGAYDRDLSAVASILAGGVRDQLSVTNPSYLAVPSVPDPKTEGSQV
jgi:aminoglycoside phosphotransferase (APT) family kinase protein